MKLFLIIKNAVAVFMASTLLSGAAAGTTGSTAQAPDTAEPPAYNETVAGDEAPADGLKLDISGQFTQPKIETATEKARDAAESIFEKVTGQPPFTGSTGSGETGSAPAPEVPGTSPATGESWEDWGESVGDSWDNWGNSYGDSWDSWGDSYGSSWESWGESVGNYFDHGFDF